MKRIILLLLLISVAGADVSQQQAGTICKKYGLESELTVVREPVMSCPDEYWLCEFKMSGEKQPIAMVVSKSSQVLGGNSAKLTQILETAYLADYGTSVLSTTLADSSFLTSFSELNSSFKVTKEKIDYLRREKLVKARVTENLTSKFESLRQESVDLYSELTELLETKNSFLSGWDCAGASQYLEGLERVLPKLANFADSWIGATNHYNAVISEISDEVFISPLILTQARLLEDSVGKAENSITSYAGAREAHVQKITANIATRLERKAVESELEEIAGTLHGSPCGEAAELFNDALEEFETGNYESAKSMARQALVMHEGYKEPQQTTGEPIDLSIYYYIAGILLVAVIVLAFMKNRGEKETVKKEKPKKKTSWTFTAGKESSIEKAADKSS